MEKDKRISIKEEVEKFTRKLENGEFRVDLEPIMSGWKLIGEENIDNKTEGIAKIWDGFINAR